jgi:hypothetical protein
MNPIEVIEIDPGAFAVCGVGQYQAHDPELPVFVPMGRERAEEVAENMRQLFASLFAD